MFNAINNSTIPIPKRLPLKKWPKTAFDTDKKSEYQAISYNFYKILSQYVICKILSKTTIAFIYG